ncbi:S26 family signal peptidase [Rhodothermaceae bacterium RA]|nr:S26 family signal peptidase [Rhodothermaceae bacterium RA]
MPEENVPSGSMAWEAAATSEARSARGALVRAWLMPLALALVAALFIRGFVFQAFRIPTESMERNLLVGDFVLVSKLHYGPRLPISIGLPFTDWRLDGVELPPRRLPGFRDVRRGDVIVFNYPAERGPIDRRTHYIKRVIAGPGDSLRIVDKVPYVNGIAQPLGPQMQQRWIAYARPGAVMPLERIQALGVRWLTSAGRAHSRIAFEGTEAMAAEVASWEEVSAVEPLVEHGDPAHGLRIFPEGSGFGRDRYGPLYVPAAGDTLHLSKRTWPAYRDLITRFEDHDARLLPNGLIEIDGHPTDRYVVRQDYFFVMGDNRDDSSDSRVWGFVPMDHIVGKAVLIYFSWDPEQQRPRFDRIFQRVE